jgi:hypothetical protein
MPKEDEKGPKVPEPNESRSIIDAPLFSCYLEKELIVNSNAVSFLARPLASTKPWEEDRTFNPEFKDEEEITYFFDFSTVDPQGIKALRYLVDSDNEPFLVFQARGDNPMSIGEKLKELVNNGKKVTHILKSSEVYGGNTESSAWREYKKALIYEI